MRLETAAHTQPLLGCLCWMVCTASKSSGWQALPHLHMHGQALKADLHQQAIARIQVKALVQCSSQSCK